MQQQLPRADTRSIPHQVLLKTGRGSPRTGLSRYFAKTCPKPPYELLALEG